MKLVNLYRFEFKKRESIFVAGSSVSEALDKFLYYPVEHDVENDPVLSIVLAIKSIYV